MNTSEAISQFLSNGGTIRRFAMSHFTPERDREEKKQPWNKNKKTKGKSKKLKVKKNLNAYDATVKGQTE